MEERAAWLRLGMNGAIGPAAQRKLLSQFGLPQHIFAASARALADAIGEEAAQALKKPADEARLTQALRWLDQPQHHLITLSDSTYPRTLLEIADPPPMLFVRGRPALLARPCLAVVGSRNPTPQGALNSEAFAQLLSIAGLTVVSGLALGIDGAAHRGALRGPGSTIAVVGAGADVTYPQRHRDLTDAIAREGAVVSEFPLGTPPLNSNFPRRNRVISGLARGVLVVEAAVGSGSLITARCAIDQGRDVFAIPGSIHSPLSKGCHALIKQGAKLVETADDVLSELHLQPARPPAARSAADRISKHELDFLAAMGYDPVTPDILCSMFNLTPDVVSAMLSRLELAGHVVRVPGGAYQRVVT
jgi:DNA processing protein